LTRARPEHADGRRKLSDATRAKLSAAGRAQYERLTPEQREAQAARIGRKPRAAGPSTDPPPKPGGEGEGRRSPFAMTPRELVRAIAGRRRGDPPADPPA
jgi:hypothetical protein